MIEASVRLVRVTQPYAHHCSKSLRTEEQDFPSHNEFHADRCAPLLTPGDALQEGVADLPRQEPGPNNKGGGGRTVPIEGGGITS